jgi:hypothetical protein
MHAPCCAFVTGRRRAETMQRHDGNCPRTALNPSTRLLAPAIQARHKSGTQWLARAILRVDLPAPKRARRGPGRRLWHPTDS